MKLLYTTFPDQNIAHKLCKKMVENKLIQCANIFDQGTSIYKWEGKITTEKEVYALLKTSRNFEDVDQFLKEKHPYQTHCLVQLTIDEVSKEYFNWIQETSF